MVQKLESLDLQSHVVLNNRRRLEKCTGILRWKVFKSRTISVLGIKIQLALVIYTSGLFLDQYPPVRHAVSLSDTENSNSRPAKSGPIEKAPCSEMICSRAFSFK